MRFHKHRPARTKRAPSETCYCGLFTLACRYVMRQGRYHPSFRLGSLEPHFRDLMINSSSKSGRYLLGIGSTRSERMPRDDQGPLAIPWANPADLGLSTARLVISCAFDVGLGAQEDLWGRCPTEAQEGSWPPPEPISCQKAPALRAQPPALVSPAATEGRSCCAWSVLSRLLEDAPPPVQGVQNLPRVVQKVSHPKHLEAWKACLALGTPEQAVSISVARVARCPSLLPALGACFTRCLPCPF